MILLCKLLLNWKTPQDATSSMHRDVKAGGKFELASLTEFILKVKYEIPTPTYQMVLKNYVPFACLVKGYHYYKRQTPFFFWILSLIYSSSVLVNSSIVCSFI
jgi:hypothetical protein